MILGVDFAGIDRNTVDAKAAYAAGVRFAYMRASFGGTVDHTFHRNADALRAAGIRVGAYAAPDFSSGAKPVKLQIDGLWGGAIAHQRGVDLPPALDFELSGRGAVDTGRSQSDLRKHAVELVHETRARFGIWPMIYTSHVQMCDDNEFDGFPLEGPEAIPGDCPLWLKVPYRLRAGQPYDRHGPRYPHYGADGTDPADFYRVPPAWQRSGWFVLQFQGDATGVAGFSGTVDANAFDELWPSTFHHDPRVMWVQRRLVADAVPRGALLASSLEVDGLYGHATEAAVKAFRASRGLTEPPNGPVDLATFCALAWVP